MLNKSLKSLYMRLSLVEEILEFMLGIFLSFLLGIVWNDLTESTSFFKAFNSEEIGIQHTTSFQFDLNINSFLVVLVITSAIIYLYTFSKKIPKKIFFLEFSCFFFIKGLNASTFISDIVKELNIDTMILFLSFIIVLYIMDKDVTKDVTKDITKGNQEKKLLTSRKKDLILIENALKKTNVVGVEAEWGEGKTFLVEKLIENIKGNADESIVINTLNLEKEDMLPLLLKQLDKILLKNKVIAFNSRKLKSFMSNQTFLGINFNGFFSSLTHKEALKEYKKIFEKLNKIIYVVFDDIDRDLDEKKINTVLSIGAEFNEKNIKFIYLYSEEILKETNFKRDYLEKYIPKSYRLTPIDFLEIFDVKFNEYKKIKPTFKVEIEEFKWIKELFREYSQSYENRNDRREELKTFIDITNILSQEIKLNIDTLSPRKVENFIEEVDILTEYRDKENLEIENRLIIALSFMKVYFYESYKKFHKMEMIEKTFPIELNIENDSKNKITLEDVQKLDVILDMEKIVFPNQYTEINNNFISEGNIQKIIDKFDLGASYKVIKKGMFEKEMIFNERERLKRERKKKELRIYKGDKHDKDYEPNFLIHSLLNYPVYTLSSSNYVSYKREKINKNIRKLVKIGEKRYLSKYELYYKYLNEIFEIKNIMERRKKYHSIWEDKKKDPEYEYLHYYGKETINIICLISKKKNEDLRSFLEIILYKEVLDDYTINILSDKRILNRKTLRNKIVDELLKKNEVDKDDPIKFNGIIKFIKNFFKEYGKENNLIIHNYLENIEIEPEKEKYINEIMRDILKEIKGKKIYELPSVKEEVEQIKKFIEWLSKKKEDSSKVEDNKISDSVSSDYIPKIKNILEELKGKTGKETYKILDEKLSKDELKGWEVELIIKELA